MSDDLSLPGLFRNAYGEATNRGRKEVTIIVPESQKDRYISELSQTRFWKEHGHGQIFPIPNSININEVQINVVASENVTEGVVIE